MSRRTVALAATAVLLAAGSASASGAAAPGTSTPPQARSTVIDYEHLMEDEVDCGTAQLLGPEAASTAHLTGGEDVALDALVLVDVAEGRAIAATKDKKQRAAKEKALFAEMRERLVVGQQPYDALGITLTLDRFALLAPTRAKRTDNAQEIIDLAKEQYGGTRPTGTDVVYVLTDLDIQLPGIGSGVAGLADCIGGVANPGNAFAVGETQPVGMPEEDFTFGPVGFYKDFTAKVFAHELGHLMGAHHHYQECGSPATVAVPRGELGPCSLMTNLVDFLTLPFSQLNAVVVRGHADEFVAGPGA